MPPNVMSSTDRRKRKQRPFYILGFRKFPANFSPVYPLGSFPVATLQRWQKVAICKGHVVVSPTGTGTGWYGVAIACFGIAGELHDKYQQRRRLPGTSRQN